MKFKKTITILITSVIILMSTITSTTATSYQMGDVNNDGKINVTDATLIQKELVGLINNYYGALSDFDRDGKTTIGDVTLIQKYCVGIISIYEDYIFIVNNRYHSATLYRYFGKDTKVNVPNYIYDCNCTVDLILKGSFLNNKNITTVTLPASVTKIDNNAFYNCSNLKTIYSYNKNLLWGNSFVLCPKFQSIEFM